jgi:hypothetical protein
VGKAHYNVWIERQFPGSSISKELFAGGRTVTALYDEEEKSRRPLSNIRNN